MTHQRQTRELDLPTYLARIDNHSPLHPAARTLANLHRAHAAAIPSENDVLLGRGISVALDRVQTKLLTSRQDGYCYEHGVLFAAVPGRLGHCASRLLARIGDKDTERPVHAPT
jgi:N-hydroxyarylamine O-acetyltransferase